MTDGPRGWARVPVRDVGRVQLGRQRSPEHHQGPNMRPYLRVANVFEDRIDLRDVMEMNFSASEAAQYELKPGDILLNEGQSRELVGRPAMYRGELPGACFTNSLVRFEAGPGILPEFALQLFRHYLKAGRFQEIAQITTNIAHLGAGRFGALEIPLPPLSEQRRIVTRLKELLAQSRRAKAAMQATSALFERLRQSILAAAFRGDLTADWRQQHRDVEPAEELLRRIRVERRGKWEEAELAKLKAKGKLPTDDHWKERYEEPKPAGTYGLPDLPNGWCWARAEEVCGFITKGTTPAAEQMSAGAGEVPFIKVYNLTTTGDLDFSVEPTFVDRATHCNELARSRVLPNDVLMNIVGPPLGKVSVVPGTYPEWNINQAIAVFRPIAGRLDTSFLTLALLHGDTIQRAVRQAKATVGQFNLTLEICRSMPLPLAPSAEQLAIAARVRQNLAAIRTTSEAAAGVAEQLGSLETVLLTKAFRGELVEQDPNDEPAEIMLSRLKAQASKEGEVAKRRPGKRGTDRPPARRRA